MKIHEYQAKHILSKFGVRIPRGEVADSSEEAKKIAQDIGPRVVVKAQIHAGGRGKGGGVKLANTPEEAEKTAEDILGMNLVTHQTGPEGKLVKKRWPKVRKRIEIGDAIISGAKLFYETQWEPKFNLREGLIKTKGIMESSGNPQGVYTK